MKELIAKVKNVSFMSVLLILINVIVFIICTFTGRMLYNMGRLSVYEFFVLGERGRLIWSLFLHGSIDHLFNNMLLLFFLGSLIEKEIGHIRFTIFYLLSGIGGGIVSLLTKLVLYDGSASIGASGAVFGMDGVLLAVVLFSDKKLANATPIRVGFMILYSLYTGFTGTNIDNGAHVGGLIVGFLAGTIMCIIQRIRKRIINVQNKRLR